MQCIEYNDKRAICIATDNGKFYRLKNISRLLIKKVKIDKCLEQKTGEKRCDYLMTMEDGGLARAIFIELKGGDLTEALKQLCSTIIYLKSEFKNCQIDARIVGSRDIPGFLNNRNYVKLAKEVHPTGGKILKGTNNIYTENI